MNYSNQEQSHPPGNTSSATGLFLHGTIYPTMLSQHNPFQILNLNLINSGALLNMDKIKGHRPAAEQVTEVRGAEAV